MGGKQAAFRRTPPRWLMDAGIALILALVGIAIERWTEGRLASDDIALWVGAGSFLLLRVGDGLVRQGRTLGCLFLVTLTWLLPCSTALFFAAVPRVRNMPRDSMPFFALLGLFLIVIMVITLERLRLADEARFARPAPETERELREMGN